MAVLTLLCTETRSTLLLPLLHKGQDWPQGTGMPSNAPAPPSSPARAPTALGQQETPAKGFRAPDSWMGTQAGHALSTPPTGLLVPTLLLWAPCTHRAAVGMLPMQTHRIRWDRDLG